MSEKWDRIWLDAAKFFALKCSKDPSTKVGAIVAKGNEFLGMGYNGFPRGIEDSEERYNDRDLKYKLVVHAEVNALIMVGKEKAKGASLYVWPSFSLPPICHDCCKTAVQYGIKEIVGYHPSPEAAERAARWQESIDLARIMCTEAGITWRGLDEIF